MKFYVCIISCYFDKMSEISYANEMSIILVSVWYLDDLSLLNKQLFVALNVCS